LINLLTHNPRKKNWESTKIKDNEG
jgi:hypothetical protein